MASRRERASKKNPRAFKPSLGAALFLAAFLLGGALAYAMAVGVLKPPAPAAPKKSRPAAEAQVANQPQPEAAQEVAVAQAEVAPAGGDAQAQAAAAEVREVVPPAAVAPVEVIPEAASQVAALENKPAVTPAPKVPETPPPAQVAAKAVPKATAKPAAPAAGKKGTSPAPAAQATGPRKGLNPTALGLQIMRLRPDLAGSDKLQLIIGSTRAYVERQMDHMSPADAAKVAANPPDDMVRRAVQSALAGIK